MASKEAIKPRKTAVQERSKFTVEAIYEAAVQVFTEHGYTSATTDRIAEKAGVSIGTLYQYFPNKKAILIGIWDRSKYRQYSLSHKKHCDVESIRDPLAQR